MDKRFETIEIKLAHQEHAVAELSDLVYGQQQQIDRLRESYRLLKQLIEELSQTTPPADPGDETPPHY